MPERVTGGRQDGLNCLAIPQVQDDRRGQIDGGFGPFRNRYERQAEDVRANPGSQFGSQIERGKIFGTQF